MAGDQWGFVDSAKRAETMDVAVATETARLSMKLIS
jgi:hypothetical protein